MGIVMNLHWSMSGTFLGSASLTHRTALSRTSVQPSGFVHCQGRMSWIKHREGHASGFGGFHLHLSDCHACIIMKKKEYNLL